MEKEIANNPDLNNNLVNNFIAKFLNREEYSTAQNSILIPELESLLQTINEDPNKNELIKEVIQHDNFFDAFISAIGTNMDIENDLLEINMNTKTDLMNIVISNLNLDQIINNFEGSDEHKNKYAKFLEFYLLKIKTLPKAITSKNNISSILNLSLEDRLTLLNVLYFILSKSKSESIEYITKQLEDSLQSVVRENTSREQQINLTTLGKEVEKINKVLAENKERFSNYKCFKGNQNLSNLSEKEKLNTIDQFYHLQNEIKEETESENKLINILNELKTYHKLMTKCSNFSYCEKVDLYLKVNEFLSSLNLKDNNDKELTMLTSNFKIKHENLMKEIKLNFITFFNENYFTVNDKHITFIAKENSKENMSIIEKIRTNFPYIILGIFQQLYDCFISYFYNKNYHFVKLTDKENSTTFNIELISNEKEYTDEDKVQNFEIFLEIIDKVTLICLSWNLKSELESNSHLIKHDLWYGGSSKKTQNSFIFVFAYNIQQFYKNFKESLLDHFTDEGDLSPLVKIQFLLNQFTDKCRNISANFESVKNLKIYDPNDFKGNLKQNVENLDLNFRKYFLNFRDLIKTSYYEAKGMKLEIFKIWKLIEEVFSLEYSEEEKEELQKNLAQASILNLDSNITLSRSFSNFIKELINYIITINKSEENLSKIFSLLYTMYNIYFKQNEFSSTEFSEILLLHNNIEAFLLCLQFLLIFSNKDTETSNHLLKSKDYFNKVIIFFKNFSSSLINQIISNFIRELIGELSAIETFEDIRFDRNSNAVTKIINTSLDLIFKFFNLFKEFANEKDFLFYLNYILSLFFDILNRKTLSVKDFNIDDTKVLAKISKLVSNNLKSNFDLMLTENKTNSYSSKIEFVNLLENNQKYKKFEEIVYVLNANMKEIRNFITQANYKIHIDPLELIDLIKAIFEDNQNRSNLIQFINEKLYLK